ncbi:MAG: hypothetical protein U0411_02180 [Thermodesulfovibrionales bacterium]
MHILLELFGAFALRRGFVEGAFIVGGAVRDLLMGKELQDVDIALTGDAREIAEEFAAETGASFVVLDAAFGVYRLVRDGSILDLAAVRRDSLSVDLAERDLTINAMALPLRNVLREPPTPCSVQLNRIDPHNGAQDLSAGVLRMVAEENFVKDPLRLLRVYRFAATLRFTVEERTLQAVGKLSSLISSVAAERVAEELRHILGAEESSSVVASMAESGILSPLLPGWENMPPAGRNALLAEYGKVEGIIRTPSLAFGAEGVRAAEYFIPAFRRVCVKLSTLLPHPGRIEETACRLKLSRKEAGLLRTLVSGKERVLRAEGAAGGRETVRLLKELGDDVYAMAVLAAGGTRDPSPYRELLSFYRTLFRERRELLPLLTGHDLTREFRLVPSPLFREILGEVEERVLEGKIRTRAEALATAGELIEGGGRKGE